MWNGSHGFFDAIYSVNMMEYLPGRFINYISLGNKFTFDKVALELDVMNRASSHQTFFLKDMSVIADLAYSPNGNWKVFGKFSYDVNKSGTDADLYVLNGTEMKNGRSRSGIHAIHTSPPHTTFPRRSLLFMGY